jgi:hypothetical protein
MFVRCLPPSLLPPTSLDNPLIHPELGWRLLIIFCNDYIAICGICTRRRTTGFVCTPLKQIFATSVSHYSLFLDHFKDCRCILTYNFP